ncbi:MAG: hypothetical protein JWR75_542 [Devosia sp.]|nr:hypothetical protein [Devosia sp.]
MLGASLLCFTTPALAESIRCENPDQTVLIEVSIEFEATRGAGSVTRVRVETPHIVMSTEPGGSDRAAEILAFTDIAYDRIEIGLESPEVGPMTFFMQLVRAAHYDDAGGPDTDIVVAGVATVASVGSVTLLCSPW